MNEKALSTTKGICTSCFQKKIYTIYMHTIKLTSKTSIEQKVPMIVVEPLEVIHPDGDSS